MAGRKWRKLVALLTHLPAEAATVEVLSETRASERWTRTEYLLAGIFDGVSAGNWQRGGGKGLRPKPWPRPGVGPEEETIGGQTSMTRAELEAFLAMKREEAGDGS